LQQKTAFIMTSAMSNDSIIQLKKSVNVNCFQSQVFILKALVISKI